MRALITAALLLVAAYAFAGTTEYVGAPMRVAWSHTISDGSVSHLDYAPPCGVGSGNLRDAGDGRERCYVPQGWNLLVTGVSGTLTESTGANKCIYTLAYSDDGTGTTGDDLAGSEIQTGQAFDCDGVTDTLDAQGENCVSRTTPLLLQAGAWAHGEVSDGDADCGTSNIYLEVYGSWRKSE